MYKEIQNIFFLKKKKKIKKLLPPKFKEKTKSSSKIINIISRNQHDKRKEFTFSVLFWQQFISNNIVITMQVIHSQ